ncbi:hypothetical protein ES044_13355 [Polaribacter sp. IC066]|nr:hypothetical protein ES043_12715 [Polaribacter sp. IC063]TXD58034.1 hypothetical protein ES044_13355 [Polaribacter sp. IC066]
MFDLENMVSKDDRFPEATRDIWQHRVNNVDWEEDWIFNDYTFNLLNCDDLNFLDFICEMIHPFARADKSEVHKLLQIFTDNLTYDNFEIVEKTRISNKPIFVGRIKINGKESSAKKGRAIKRC